MECAHPTTRSYPLTLLARIAVGQRPRTARYRVTSSSRPAPAGPSRDGLRSVPPCFQAAKRLPTVGLYELAATDPDVLGAQQVVKTRAWCASRYSTVRISLSLLRESRLRVGTNSVAWWAVIRWSLVARS